MKYIINKYYLLKCFLFVFTFNWVGYSQEVFRDDFNVPPRTYNQNVGTRNFSGPWTEINDVITAGLPTSGDIRIRTAEDLLFNANDGVNRANLRIRRTINLSGATNANLIFNWRTQNLDGGASFGFTEELGVFISSNGQPFQQVGNGTIIGNNTFNINNITSGLFNISLNGFISPNTIIEFRVIGGNLTFEGNENVRIDNFRVEANFGAVLFIDNQLNISEESNSATFTVTRTNVLNSTVTINYSTSNGSAISGADYITTTGSLTFLPNETTQTISVPIIYSILPEVNETFFVDLFNPSANVTLINNQGQGIIIDDNDVDNDSIPDNIDLDIDNDGIPNCFEDRAQNTTISDVFSINGNAIQISDFETQLTPPLNGQAGSMNINDRIDFSTNFNFPFEVNLGSRDGNGADGIAIIFHNDPAGANAVGNPGDGLGAEGIANGIVLELDTFNNGNFGDISNDHGMIWDSDNRTGLGGLLTPAINLGNIEDGLWHSININWNANTQTISYTIEITPGNIITAGTYTDDLVSNFFGGQNLVFFGFSASTGALNNDHRIRFNPLCDIPLFVDNDGDGLPNYLDLDSDNDGILDIDETNNGNLDTNNDGTLNTNDSGFSDTNNDGLDDDAAIGFMNLNSDTDDLPNFLDFDSDNDNCLDAIEATGNFIITNIDNSGIIPQLSGGQDINGIPNLVSPNGQATNVTVISSATETINTSPTNITSIVGSNESFTIDITANGILSYQWQQRLTPTSPWTNLINGGVNPTYSNSTTNSLSINSIPLSLNKSQYRVRYINNNNQCDEKNSTIATLIVRTGTVVTNKRITYRVNPN